MKKIIIIINITNNNYNYNNISLGLYHNPIIVYRRFLVRSHNSLVLSDRISIQFNQKLLENGQKIVRTHGNKKTWE